jgi:hypothetical protein
VHCEECRGEGWEVGSMGGCMIFGNQRSWNHGPVLYSTGNIL